MERRIYYCYELTKTRKQLVQGPLVAFLDIMTLLVLLCICLFLRYSENRRLNTQLGCDQIITIL